MSGSNPLNIRPSVAASAPASHRSSALLMVRRSSVAVASSIGFNGQVIQDGGLGPVEREGVENMQAEPVEEPKTVVEKVAQVPIEIGDIILSGAKASVATAETVGHDVVKVTIEGAALVVDATKAVGAAVLGAVEKIEGHEKATPPPAPKSPAQLEPNPPAV